MSEAKQGVGKMKNLGTAVRRSGTVPVMRVSRRTAVVWRGGIHGERLFVIDCHPQVNAAVLPPERETVKRSASFKRRGEALDEFEVMTAVE